MNRDSLVIFDIKAYYNQFNLDSIIYLFFLYVFSKFEVIPDCDKLIIVSLLYYSLLNSYHYILQIFVIGSTQ